jgi:TolB protein
VLEKYNLKVWAISNHLQGQALQAGAADLLVSTEDWATPLHTWRLCGGQGTLNVNSWSPDSASFAYVAYPPATDSTKD